MDWYRHEEWNEEIEKFFFQKLSKARIQRDQYIVIQAIHLEKTYPNISLKLIDYYFETKKTSFHDSRALNVRIRAYLQLADNTKTLEAYKALVDYQDTHERPGTDYSSVYIDCPFFIASRKIKHEYEYATNTLEKSTPINRATLILEFKLFATIAFISFEDDGYDIAQINAQRALDMVDISLSDFEKKLSRTPFDGYGDTIQRLQEIVNYHVAEV